MHLDPIRQISIAFRSPTVFSRNGRPYALPDPQLVMTSLVGRWNSCAEASKEKRVPDHVRELLCREVALRSFDGHAIGVGRKDEAGFVGSTDFYLRHADEEVGRWMAAVWTLAEYTGVGAELACGSGRIEILEMQ